MAELDDLRDRIRADFADEGRAEPLAPEHEDLAKRIRAGFQAEKAQQDAAMNVILEKAATFNPDKSASVQDLATKMALPVDYVERNEDAVRRQNLVQNTQRALVKSPVLAMQLTDPEFAKIAYDNVQSLSGIEDYVGAMARYVVGAQPDGGLPGFAWRSMGTFAGGVNQIETAEWGGLRLVGDLLGDAGAPISSFAARKRQESEARTKRLTPQTDGALASGWYSGMQSLGLNLAMLPLAFVPGAQPVVAGAALAPRMAPLLSGLGTATGLLSYGQAREQNVGVLPSLMFGASQGVIEAGTEMLGMPALFSLLKPGKALTKVVEYALKEQGGEQIDTVLQDLNEWGVLPENKNKTVADYLKERPSASLQTAIATLVGGGGQVAVMKGLGHALNRADYELYRLQQSEEQARLLDGLVKLAASDKVLARNPESFQTFLQDMNPDEGPAHTLYFQASDLQETGVAEQLAQVSPSIATQLPEALQTGGVVAVPVDEVLTNIAPTEYAQSLVDIARVNDPQAWTRREGQAYEESAEGQALSEYVERQLAERQDDDTFTASRDAVKAQILADMNTVGRFSSDKNEVDAMAYASYYAVRAAQMGVTPEELYARRRVLFAGRSGGGFEQALAEQPPKGWVHSTSGQDASSLFNGQTDAQAVFWTDLQGKLAQDAPALAGYSHSVDVSAAQHIKSQHGDVQAESKRGQVGVTPEDVARIPDVVTQYDDARWEREDRGSKLVAFAKQVDDGVLVYLARVSDRRRNMAAVSMMKFKPGVDPSVALARALQEKAPHKAGQDSKPRTLSDYESDARAGNLGASIDQGGEFWQSQDAPDQQGYIDGKPYRPKHEALSDAEKQAVVDAYNAHATTELDSVGKIEDSNDIGAKSMAFQALAQREGWHFDRDAAGSKYFWIRNADGATLNVRISDHANVNRGEHYKTSSINIAPDDGANGFDTFSSALWKMRNASINDELDTLIDGEEPVYFQSLWHGTPHRGIEETGFSLNKIGTGEGAQAYGWGIYGAEARPVADGYAWNLGRAAGGLQTIGGQSINDFYDAIDKRAARLKGDAAHAEYDKLSMVEALMEEHASPQSVLDKAQEREFTPEAVEWFKKEVAPKYRGPGQLYSFEIPDDAPLLDWDKPLSRQPEPVKRILRESGLLKQHRDFNNDPRTRISDKGKDGQSLYHMLVEQAGSPQAASEYLLSLGIHGIRYLDGNSRNDGQEATRNYVIWDEALLTPEAAQIKAYYQSGLTPTAQAQAQWRDALAKMSPDNLDYTARMDVPAVLQAMGVSASRLELPTRYLLAIHEKHPDVPQSVFENLPALLSDPLMVYPYAKGGWRVVTEATTAKGEPIVVGIGEEGRIQTIKPVHDEEGKTGVERVREAFERSRRDVKRYIRNKEAPALAGASTGAPSATIALRRDSLSRRNLITRDALVKKHGSDFYQKYLGSFNPETLTVSLLKGADLSTALHEGAHFFFENDIMLASEILAGQAQGTSILPGEQEILNDVSSLLKWHGVQGDLREQLAQWFNMSHEEKTAHHERTAESFERYLLEGKAPSLELQSYFQKFRAWMLSVYKSVRDFLAEHPEAGKLDDEVRQIFDRMLATSEQIKLAEESRSLMPLFTNPAESGMSVEDQGKYQSDQHEATATAIDRLQARVLKDQQWRANARAREIKRLQSRHKALRSEMQIEARRQVLQSPIYRVYQFLTNKIGEEDKLPPVPQPPKTTEINPARDTLIEAIAKLGGVARESAGRDLGVHSDDYRTPSGVFGKPVFRKTGGMDADAMAELLAEYGYLRRDEHGKHDLHEFEDRVTAALGGSPEYSAFHEPVREMRPGEQAFGLDEIGAGRLDLVALQEMYGAAPTKPEDFVRAPDGGLDFGEITPEAGRVMRRQAGKIRLRLGNSDWGLLHIQQRHGADVAALGYPSVQAFVSQVATGFTKVYQGRGAALNVVLEDAQRGMLIVSLELSTDGDFYDIKTATPIRANQFKNKKPLWERAGPSTSTAQDGSPYPRGQSDIDSVSDDTAIVQTLKSRRLTARNGLHPDIVAELFGFDSGDQLARSLARVPTLAEAVQAATDQLMLERHGDLSTPEAIERAADMAVHNEARARLLAAETNALEQAVGKRKTLMPLAKQYAAEIVARLTIRNLLPSRYTSAETRAAKLAKQAHDAGDLATAASEKRNQMVQHYAARATYDAQDEVDAGLRYLRKFLRRRPKSLDADYAEQIEALLERYDLRQSSNKEADSRKSLRSWVMGQIANGEVPDIAMELLAPQDRSRFIAQTAEINEHGEYVYAEDGERAKLLADYIERSAKTSWRDLSVERFRGLVETVKQIEHIGRLKNRLLTQKEGVLLDAVKDEIDESIRKNALKSGKAVPMRDDIVSKAKRFTTFAGESHIRMAIRARVMDGDKDMGPMWRYFIRPANKAGQDKLDRTTATTTRLNEILKPVLKRVSTIDRVGKGKHYESLGTSLNWVNRFAILLNMGNEGNMQRLLSGGVGGRMNLTLRDVMPILSTFSAAELRAAQQIWDLFEENRPEVAALSRETKGKEPEWIEPRALTIRSSDGQMVALRGGYYPVVYDPLRNARVAEHLDAEEGSRALRAARAASTTRQSFTKARAGEVNGRPLLLTLDAMFSGFSDVIQYLSHERFSIDMRKLLNSKRIQDAMREHYGAESIRQLRNWADDLIVGPQRLNDFGERAASFTNKNTSLTLLALNFLSWIKQPFGITNAVPRLGGGAEGVKWVARGVARYAINPVSATREAMRASAFMKNRTRTRFRELNEIRNQIEVQGIGQKLAPWLMVGIAYTQLVADTIVWHAAKERAVANDPVISDDDVVDISDQAVRDSQGGGETVDLSAVERGSPMMKLFTTLFNFQNTGTNLAGLSLLTKRSAAKRVVDMFMIYTVPVLVDTWVASLLIPGGDGDDDDDDEKKLKKFAVDQLVYLLGSVAFVRELNPAVQAAFGEGFGYKGPTGLKLFSDAYNFGQQAGQGELDEAFTKALINLTGDLTGLPSTQVNRAITGAKALSEGKTENPLAIGFGFKERR